MQEPGYGDDKLSRLDTFGLALSKKRTEAISGRTESGIEDEWIEDDEPYEGVDEATRNPRSTWSIRPVGMVEPKSADTRSRVFLNITRPYVDAAAAQVSDMLLPTGDRNFSLTHTPIPDDMESLSTGEFTQAQADAISSLGRNLAQKAATKAVQDATQIIAQAKKKADKAQDQIDDWLVECRGHAEVRKIIEDAAKVGTGVIKGPFPVKRKVTVLSTEATGPKLILKEEIKPASKRINYWNLFHDPACGNDIHRGSYIWEKDYLPPKMLTDLKGVPGYISEQIDLALEEGPQKASSIPEASRGKDRDRDVKGQFELWHYHGVIEKEDMEAAGYSSDDHGEEGQPDQSDQLQTSLQNINAVVSMVNNRVIRATLNPLDTGSFPYDVFVWQAKVDHWTGIGVSRQIRTPQRMVNAAARNMMDNARRSAQGLKVMKLGALVPSNGTSVLGDDNVYYINEASDVTDVNNVFKYYEIPSRQQELMNIVTFALKMAEDVTGIQLLLQVFPGQMGKAPDTLGGMQMKENKSAGVLRRLARLFDDRITIPHIRRYYTWLLQYVEDDSMKGDFQVDARGSSALVERDLQNQATIQMAPFVLNPAFGLNPKLWIKEWLKSQRLNPANFEYSEEELKEMQAQQQNQPPPDPRLQTAQLDAQVEQMKLKFEAQEREKDRQLEMLMAQMDQELEAAKLAGTNKQAFEKLKAMLATTTLKIKTQKELSAAGMAIDLHKSGRPTPNVTTPPTEPSGRAPNGMAFQA